MRVRDTGLNLIVGRGLEMVVIAHGKRLKGRLTRHMKLKRLGGPKPKAIHDRGIRSVQTNGDEELDLEA